MRLVFCIFMIVFLSGCGVDTDSSSRSGDTNGTIPDDTNTSNPDDSNTTDPIDEDLGDPNADQSQSDFDTRSAIKDQNACIINETFKNGMEDSSFDPTGSIDEVNGITIASLLTYSATVDMTKVTVYYPDLIATPVGTQTSVYKNNYYRLSFDQSWPANTNKTIYVRTPRGIDSNYYGCMRYTLSTSAAATVGQRVYRVNE